MGPCGRAPPRPPRIEFTVRNRPREPGAQGVLEGRCPRTVLPAPAGESSRVTRKWPKSIGRPGRTPSPDVEGDHGRVRARRPRRPAARGSATPRTAGGAVLHGGRPAHASGGGRPLPSPVRPGRVRATSRALTGFARAAREVPIRRPRERAPPAGG